MSRSLSEQLAESLGTQNVGAALGIEAEQPEEDRPEMAEEGLEDAEEFEAADGESQEDAEGESPEGYDADDGEIRTIADLAAANEWDPADLYALEVAMPSGQQPIKLGQMKDELIKARQETQALQQQVQQHQQMVGELQQQVGVSQQVDHVLQEIGGRINALQSYLEGETMQKLREENPGLAASKYQEVQQAIQQLTAEGDKYLGERRQMEQVRDQEALRGMVHYIGEKIPEWRDPALVKRERPGIESLFNAYGYSPQEIAMLRDPRALHMARDLMLAKSTQAKAGTPP